MAQKGWWNPVLLVSRVLTLALGSLYQELITLPESLELVEGKLGLPTTPQSLQAQREASIKRQEMKKNLQSN